MDETPVDNQEDFEFDPNEQEKNTVAVAPNPSMNGAAHRELPHHSPQPVMADAKTTYTYKSPLPNSMMGRINNRPAYANEKPREKDDRDFLDDFNLKAEAGEYQLSCTRYQPQVNAEGELVPHGIGSRTMFQVMRYDELQSEIIEAWGGGAYRVTFCDEAGRRATDISRCILINIPTTQHPPKREKNERIDPLSKSLKITPTDAASDEEKSREREYKELMAEERRQEALDRIETSKQKRQFEKLKREREIEQMRKELLAPSTQKPAELAILEKKIEDEKRERETEVRRQEEDRKEERRRYDEERKEAQRRSDEDRRIMMEGMLRLGESIKEIANRPPPPKDNTMEAILSVMAPVLTAIISKPQPLPPDNKELIVAMNESQRSSMQLVSAALSKPKDDTNEKMFDAMVKLTTKDNSTRDSMIQGLMQAIMSKDKGQTLTPDMIFALQDKMEQRFERMAGLGQEIKGGDGEGEGDGYDPALGFLGNAGKALFGSLKALMDSAATNPQLLELAAKLIGSRNPTDQQLAQVAYQMERSGGIPPAMAMQQYPALPPGYAPINQQAIQYQQQMPPPQQQQRSMPPPMPQAQQQNPASVQTPQVVQQQSVVDELEGTSSGLPSNADPVQQAPMTPEELADENLIDSVTRTVEIMIGEAVGKPATRTWVEDATQHWNKSFIKQLVDCTDNRERLKILGSKCDPQVAQKLSAIWAADVGEQNVFWTEFMRFIQINRAVDAPAPAVAQTAPVAQPNPVV